MLITQNTKTFGNLTITRTRMEDKKSINKHIDVSRFNGEYCEILSPQDPDYTKALIMAINEDNGY
jgi:hypothetical protein